MPVAFAMTMGPNEADMVIDNLEAIAALYPDAVTWIRDDSTTDGTWEQVSAWARGRQAQGTSVHLSRNPAPRGYYHIAQTFSELLLELAPSKPSLLIKIDPDTVLLRPGLDTLFRARFAKYGNGICGSYKLSPGGATRDFSGHRRAVLADLLPIGREMQVAGLRLRPVGYFPYILRALRNGYELGENVQGGLYAIDGATLANPIFLRFLKAVAHGRRGKLWTEDVMFTLGVKAVGGTISSMNEGLTDIPTHIQAMPPLVLDPAIVEAGHLLAVHPVKRDAEPQRAYFRSVRERALTADRPSS